MSWVLSMGVVCLVASERWHVGMAKPNSHISYANLKVGHADWECVAMGGMCVERRLGLASDETKRLLC